MGVTYHHGISILEVGVFTPSFFLALFLTTRHGFSNSSGFFWLALFTLTRIVGACCDLATIQNYTKDLYIASAICSSIGLSPLILACSGLLSRANESIEHRTSKPAIPNFAFHLLRILTIVALALSIAGITANMTPEGLQHPDIKVKVGMILYVVSWAQLALFLVLVAWKSGFVEKGERRTLVAVALSLPLLLVRMIYALLIWFLHDSTFSMMNGNETVQLVMSVLEEIAVVIICLAIGMTLKVRGKPSREGQEQEYASKP